MKGFCQNSHYEHWTRKPLIGHQTVTNYSIKYRHFWTTSSIHAPHPMFMFGPRPYENPSFYGWLQNLLWANTRQKELQFCVCVCAIMSHWLTLMPYAARIRERAVRNENRHSSRRHCFERLCSSLSRPISNYRALSLLITSGSAWLWQCDDGCCALILPHSAANAFACTDGSRLANSRTLT